MAPEQTGRMNRAIDHRSDLYSLGVTFYQMLTGSAAVHRHRPAGVGALPHRPRSRRRPRELVPGMPEPLAAIVLKLLAKTAEERYQSAAGLRSTSSAAWTQWESSGASRRSRSATATLSSGS